MRPFSRQYLQMAGAFAYYGFKMRDQSTILGFVWTLLHPLLLFVILFMLFRQRLGAGIPNFGVYLLIGIVNWSLFSTATSKAVNCILARRDMVVSMKFPRELIVLGDVGGVAASSLLEFLVVCCFALAVGVAFKATWLLLPLVFLAQLIFVVAVSLVLASLQVFVRDTERIWSLILRMGFFAVPVFYPMTMLADGISRSIIQANPLTQYMDYSRALIIDGRIPPTGEMVYTVAVSCIVLALGFTWFRRIEDSFAERL
jgi:ABC-2 type transport system permease protein